MCRFAAALLHLHPASVRRHPPALHHAPVRCCPPAPSPCPSPPHRRCPTPRLPFAGPPCARPVSRTPVPAPLPPPILHLAREQGLRGAQHRARGRRARRVTWGHLCSVQGRLWMQGAMAHLLGWAAQGNVRGGGAPARLGAGGGAQQTLAGGRSMGPAQGRRKVGHRWRGRCGAGHRQRSDAA